MPFASRSGVFTTNVLGLWDDAVMAAKRPAGQSRSAVFRAGSVILNYYIIVPRGWKRQVRALDLRFAGPFLEKHFETDICS